MSKRDVIVIGASAGGTEVLQEIVRHLPEDLHAAVFIVLHITPYSRSALPAILRRAGKLPVHHATDGEPIKEGRIYVAPPDRHMVLEPGRVRLTKGPKENRARPSVDVLFRSAAYHLGARVVGVILSGALDDGTAGLWAIKDRGGLAIVQDPNDAQHPSMPTSALHNVAVDYTATLPEIAPILARLAGEPVQEHADRSLSEKMHIETKIGLEHKISGPDMMQLGELSQFTCPECHGSLLQLTNGNLKRFRCFTGHALTSESLLADLTDSAQTSLWIAIRTIEERVRLLKHLAQHAAEVNRQEVAALLTHQADEGQRCADLVRQAAMLQEPAAPAE